MNTDVKATGQEAPEPQGATLSAASRHLMIAHVRAAYQSQRLEWQALCTGVALGAEEVQDQRLAAAEAPPKSDSGDLLLLLVVFLLEAPAGIWAARAAQQAVVGLLKKSLTRQEGAHKLLLAGRDAARAELKTVTDRLAARTAKAGRRTAAAGEGGTAARKRAEDAVANAATAQREVARAEARLRTVERKEQASDAAFSATLRALNMSGDELLPDVTVAALKVLAPLAPDMMRPQQIPAGPGLPSPVSPGVSLRASIEKQALRVAQNSYFCQELYEFQLQSPKLTAEAAADVLDRIGVIGGPVDTDALVDDYRLLTAALIWGRLLSVKGNHAGRLDAVKDARARGLSFPLPKQAADLFDAPETHHRYLAARFGPAAEAWARANPGAVVLPGIGAGTSAEVNEYVDYSVRSGSPAGTLGRFAEGVGDAFGRLVGDTPSYKPQSVRIDLILQWLEALGEHAPPALLEALPEG